MLIKAKIKWVLTMIVMAGLFTVPVAVQSIYGNPYDDYGSRYWSDRYRRESYRFYWPPRVHRSYSIGFPYEYYGYPPYYPPYYGGGYYGQYPQYQQPQPEQKPQSPQMTKEQIEQAVEEEVTRQVDNISQAFIAGNYGRAVVRAQEAVKQMPDNTTLRFIYSQTLFADGRYPNAAISLRSTLEKMLQTGQQNVYYAASLYPDQETLNKQIDKLTEAVKKTPSSSNLKLLLGYQLLGVGRTDEGIGYIEKAARDSINEKSARFLMRVSSKITRNFELKAAQKPVTQLITSEKTRQKLTAEPVEQKAKTSSSNVVNNTKRKTQSAEPNY